MDDYFDESLREAPKALTFEQNIISSLIENGAEAWDKVADILQPEHFFDPRHAELYRIIGEIISENKPIDPSMLFDDLTRTGQLEKVGGQAYFHHIVGHCVHSSANSAVQAQRIKKLAMVRSLLKATAKINEQAYRFSGEDLDVLLDNAEQAIFEVKQGAPAKGAGLRHGKDVLMETLEQIDARCNRGSKLVGVDTGFDGINEMMLGLIPKDLVVLAALPGMGKTTLAMNMVENALMSKTLDGPVLFFSQEMGDCELMERIISSVGLVNQTAIRKGDLDDFHWNSITRATVKIKDWPLYIDETNGISPIEMRTRVRRMARQTGGKIGLIVVDYIQLMAVAGCEDNPVQELTIISKSLKSLAKEMKCPVLALSQLNRGIEKRPNKRPMNSDLKGSGSIEQDADVIMFIYRDDAYNPDSEHRGMAEVIFNKHRKGPKGTVMLGFDGGRSRFVNLGKASA